MGDIRHGDHLLAERIDGDVDRAPGLHLDTPAGQLLEDDAALVGRNEQRIVDLQLEVVLAGQPLCVAQSDTREIGHRAPCVVARADLHDDVSDDGQADDDGRDEQKVVDQGITAKPVEPGTLFLHCFRIIWGPSGRDRPL